MGNALATTSGSSAYNGWGNMKYNTRLMHSLAELAMLANTGSDIILTKNYSIRQKTQKTEMFFVLQKGNDLENSHQSFITQCVQHCSTSSFSVGSADVQK